MKPLLLHYYLTNRCNSRCTFCSIWQEQHKVDAKEADVVRNLRTARKRGCSFVDFTGGEPLLHKALPDFLIEAKKLGFITSVTTNCLLFPSRVKELAGLIDLLHFSIDSDNESEHDSLRGVPCYSSVIKSIPLALSHGLYPDLLYTYTNKNIDSVSGVYKIARENKLVLILDPVFDPWGPDKISNLTHRKALDISKQPGIYLNRAHLHLRSKGGNHVRSPLCQSVSTTIVIDPENNLVLPCYHHRSTLLPIGSDLTGPLSSSHYITAWQNQGKYSYCENCHLNCYFDPTYTYLHNVYTFYSLLAKLKYFWAKYIMYKRPFPGSKKVFSKDF